MHTHAYVHSSMLSCIYTDTRACIHTSITRNIQQHRQIHAYTSSICECRYAFGAHQRCVSEHTYDQTINTSPATHSYDSHMVGSPFNLLTLQGPLIISISLVSALVLQPIKFIEFQFLYLLCILRCHCKFM